MRGGGRAVLLAAILLAAGGARGAAGQTAAGLDEAEAALEAGDVERARAALETWLAAGADERGPERARARYLEGRLAADPEEAERHYAWAAVEGGPRYGALARLALAQLRLARGEAARALEDLDRLRADYPGSDVVPRSWWWTAVAREAAGDAAGACEAWDRALASAPEDPELREVAASSAGGCPGLEDALAGARGGWSVQLGAFRSREAAEALLREARARGVEARVEPPDAEGWHRVRAGRFGTPEEARVLAGELSRRGYEAIVVEGP